MKPTPDISVLLPDEETIQARRAALVDSVRPSARRRSRGLVVAIAALFALGGGVALAAGVFSADDIAVEAGVGCYERPSLDAGAAIYAAAADPVAKCARTWREGAMTGGRSTEVPHLVACAAEDRPVMVFPGEDAVCERLGLSPLPSDYAAAGRAHAGAYAALFMLRARNAPAPNSICPSPQAQAAYARDLLSGAHPDVPVSIEGSGPCGGGYGLGGAQGDRIVVVTVSRARSQANRDAHMRRREWTTISDILLPVFGRPPRYRRARMECQDPKAFVAAARRVLAEAGRRDVALRIVGDGACVSLSARYSLCCIEVSDAGTQPRFVATLRTMTRANWRWSKRQDRKWKALREAAGAGT